MKILFIRHEGRNVRIRLDEIIYIEAGGNYTTLVMSDATYRTFISLLSWERLLPAQSFCRIHRMFIIALDKVRAFDKSTVSMPDKRIPIGPTYARRLEEAVSIIIAPQQELRSKMKRSSHKKP